jgi:hypothetical protein
MITRTMYAIFSSETLLLPIDFNFGLSDCDFTPKRTNASKYLLATT